MNIVTLDSIREAAEAKYGMTRVPFGPDGEYVDLLNPLRLPKAKRDSLQDMQKDSDAEGTDQLDVFANMIRLVADNEARANELITMIGDDLAVMASVVEAYTKGVQVGEA